MTYPDPVYHGRDGEQSAQIRRSDEPADLEYTNGGSVDYLATGGTTGGAFGLYRWNFGTARTGPDPHFHRSISESFFILDGAVTIFDGADWVETRAGDFAHVPPGGIHGFRNESGEPASMLLLFTPGAPREEYFETLKALGSGLTMSDTEEPDSSLPTTTSGSDRQRAWRLEWTRASSSMTAETLAAWGGLSPFRVEANPESRRTVTECSSSVV